jgi:hypothetical protein
MRGTSPFALPAIILAMCLPAGSQARDLNINAAVGQQVRVFGHVRFARDCRPGAVPDMTIVDAPKLGTLTVRTETVTLTNPDFGTCPAGSAGLGTVVYYTAEASGQDRFHYRMSSPGLPTTDWMVTVEVH